MKHKQKRQILEQIIRDFEVITEVSGATGRAALLDAKAGLLDDAIYKLVEVEAELHRALSMINMAAYTKRLRLADPK